MDSQPDERSISPSQPGVRPRRRWVGTLVAIVGLAALGGGAWYLTHRPAATSTAQAGFGGPGGPGGPGGAGGGRAGRGAGGATTVGEFTARKADIPVMLEALGTVMPMVTATVRPQVSGVLKQVLFTEGQMVKQGQVLAVIDPQPFQIALTQATGARIRDEAQLENARLTLERYRTLLSQDSIARQDVDTQASLVKQLEGTVTIDRANEATARLNLGYSRIVAPVAGRVGLRVVDTGNYISAGDTNGVAVITQMSPIDVSFALPQDRVPELQARMAEGVKLPATALDRTRVTQLDAGVFSTLDNQIDTTTGTVRAKARFPNGTGTLFPSQFVNLKLQLRIIQGAVVVPVTAIRTGSQGDFVYVLNDDRTVSLRNVKRGEATNEYIAIAEGLQAGERVVTEGADRLKDGARVQLAADRAATAASGASAPGRRASGAFGGASGPRRRASDAAGGGDWSQRRAASGVQGDGRP
jgi:multidrug efflux system membrane fusion protein